ncbi:hypothetical protein RIF29_18416 [Crotalaria pallida]|uniref:Uncharacterized protein n=1 Tax=Crotalaria pallida TaxID=3830 RepID=A0AAN9FJU5_CROPI
MHSFPGMVGGSGSGSGTNGNEEGDDDNSRYRRYTNDQKAILEQAFNNCPHPDEWQRLKLSRELSLDPKKIKYWFQNQRVKVKIDKVYKSLEPYGYVRNQLSQSVMMLSHHTPLPTLDENMIFPSSDQDHINVPPPALNNNHHDVSALTQQFGSAFGISNNNNEMAMMVDTAMASIHELTSLLNMEDDRFWFLSNQKLILRRDVYEAMFPKSNHLSNPQAYKESSKDWKMVSVSSAWLVDMFQDAEKWVNLFPTIVKSAQTIQVIESGLYGSLQLMYAEMHILSPLVPTRKVLFLRSCKKMAEGVWVIADVSFDSQNHNGIPYQTWRFPSGCMIQDMTNGSCLVTWMEHMEVNDKMQTHMLYKELICDKNAYGAERWLLTLERMCQRFALASMENIPTFDMGVINLPKGRRSVMYLAHRMVKIFCGSLDMSGNIDVTNQTNINYSGSRVSLRNNTIPGVPQGIIVIAATSIWLPLSPQIVFNFLKDSSTRHQTASMHNNQNLMILQESCVDSLGALLVFAPLDMESINFAIRGEDPTVLPILPSGFTISRDGRSEHFGAAGQSSNSFGHVGNQMEGSLLTLAIQVLISPASTTGHFNLATVVKVNDLITSVVEKIRAALNSRRA